MIPTFQLGGVDFGGDHPVQVVGFDPGSGSTRTQDVDVPMGDGRLMGRDFHSAPSWMFDFYTNVWDWAEALDLADTVAAVWSGDQVRDTPGEVMPLRYWMADRWRRVYGRPRNFSPPDGGLFSKLGRAEFAASFDLVDRLHYDDAEQSASADMVPTLTAYWLSSRRSFSQAPVRPTVMSPRKRACRFCTARLASGAT